MKIIERSFGADEHRPRPEIYTSDNGNLCLVVTPWGPRSTAKKAIKLIQDQFFATEQDVELTAPIARISGLSTLANNLRIAIKMANDNIYSNENKNEFTSGFELFAIARNQNEVAWVQIGHPTPILKKSGCSFITIGSNLDLTTEFSYKNLKLAPLPNKLLGVDLHSDFNVESTRIREGDQLLLISMSNFSIQFLTNMHTPLQINAITKDLSIENPERAFWVGIIELLGQQKTATA